MPNKANNILVADPNLDQGSSGPCSNGNAIKAIAIFPTEIIRLVFCECASGGTIHLPMSYSCSTTTMPWVLGQVCSSWKEISQNEPSLWSSLSLSYKNVTDKETLTRRVKEIILPRIKFDLISLTCFDGDDRSSDGAGIVAILILPNLAQFRHLSLSIASTALQPLNTSPPGSFKSLESVELEYLSDPSSVGNRQYDVFRPGSITAFEDAPMLHKVSLKTDLQFFSGFAIALPWSQLTKLRMIKLFPHPPLMAFLPNCTQLTHCDLSVDHDFELRSKFTLLHLQSISLHLGPSQACWGILKNLTLPALKTMKLSLPFYCQAPMDDMLLELFARSGCLLEIFEVPPHVTAIDNIAHIDNIGKLLEAMPYLRKLCIPDEIPLTIPVITRMIEGELVPHLESMHCAVESVPMILDLLETRRSDKSPGASESYRGIECAILLGSGVKEECKCRIR